MAIHAIRRAVDSLLDDLDTRATSGNRGRSRHAPELSPEDEEIFFQIKAS
jgi:hypothetical protein